MGFLLQYLWWIIGGLVLLLVVAAVIIMRTNLIHKMRDKMSPNSDKHIQSKLFGEDKQIRDRQIKIDTYSVIDDAKMRAYHLVHDLLITSAATGKQFLCVGERDAFPIDFNGKLTPAKRKQYPTAQQVYIDTANNLDNKATSEEGKNMAMMSLSIIVLVGAIVVVVFACVMFWQSKGGGGLI